MGVCTDKHTICTFCGERGATSEWRGLLSEVTCCRQCALSILPKFIADALHPIDRRGDYFDFEARIRTEFLYAIVMNSLKS